MSDSFADLWTSSSSNLNNKPQSLASQAALNKPNQSGGYTNSNVAKKYDAFSVLASTSSNSSSRSMTPQPSASPSMRSLSQSKGLSAFDDLVPIKAAADKSSASLASKLKQATPPNGAFTSGAAQAKPPTSGNQDPWDFDFLTSKAPPKASGGGSSGFAMEDVDDLLGELGKPSRSSVSPQPSMQRSLNDDLLGDFGIQSAPSISPQPSTSGPKHSQLAADDDDIFGEFAKQPVSSSSSLQPSQTAHASSLNETSFGDDILGDLGKPISTASRSAPPIGHSSSHQRSPPRSPSLRDDDDDEESGILRESESRPPRSYSIPSRRPDSRSVSPPPHVIGQIVEMGFTPDQARVALASTATGVDVQAALETLISNTQGGSFSTGPEDASEQQPSRSRPKPRHRDSSSSDTASQQQQRQRLRAAEMDRPSSSNSNSDAINLGEQADKLLAQATQIGKGMFDRANAFWKVGKETVQKAYEERAVASASGGNKAAGANGRPKWMTEDVDGFKDEEGEGFASKGFTDGNMAGDDDDDGWKEPPPQPKPARKKTQPTPSRDDSNLLGSPVADAITSTSPARTPYRSPLRRPQSVKTPSAPTSRAPTPHVPPAPRPHRHASVTCSQSQLDAAARHKAKGNDQFKLGAYADAETSFSLAIESLPANHLLLIPLYTNRALARYRNGAPKGCIEDSVAALEIIGDDYQPAEVTSSTDVKLDDAFMKALRRRAEGYEALEKWELAMKDWERLSGTSWAQGKLRSEAASGAARCRRMLAPPPPKPAVVTKPKPIPVARPTAPSETVNRLREANVEQEAEDSARHALKDTVDAKLAAWIGGKENNLRALLANLDVVLWEELNWKKIGMAELVSEKQVKVQYTKAISKVHPDKLSNMKVSTENRMIANSVFATLNEAWVNFKP